MGKLLVMPYSKKEPLEKLLHRALENANILKLSAMDAVSAVGDMVNARAALDRAKTQKAKENLLKAATKLEW